MTANAFMGILRAGPKPVLQRHQRASWPAHIELGRRQQGLAPEIVARAWAAQQRLSGRLCALAARKNAKSIVAAAIARELAGFLWAEMTA